MVWDNKEAYCYAKDKEVVNVIYWVKERKKPVSGSSPRAKLKRSMLLSKKKGKGITWKGGRDRKANWLG